MNILEQDIIQAIEPENELQPSNFSQFYILDQIYYQI